MEKTAETTGDASSLTFRDEYEYIDWMDVNDILSMQQQPHNDCDFHWSFCDNHCVDIYWGDRTDTPYKTLSTIGKNG